MSEAASAATPQGRDPWMGRATDIISLNREAIETPDRTMSRDMERVIGIEPTSSAWKAEVLPLNYTRLFIRRLGILPNFSVLDPEQVRACGASRSHIPVRKTLNISDVQREFLAAATRT